MFSPFLSCIHASCHVPPVIQSKDTEGQLRHRLNAQVAETENLRQELVSSRDRSEQAEEAVRASEQRAKEGADKKTKGLLAEMETLCQEKLLAENKADEMEAELDRLRGEVAGAEQRAARDQSMIIRASEERMTVFEEVQWLLACGSGGGGGLEMAEAG